MVLAMVQLAILSTVGLVRFFLLAQMSQQGVAGGDYGLFLFCSSIASIVVPFAIGHHIDRGRYRAIAIWGVVMLSALAFWLLRSPPQSLTLMACSFTLVASCAVVAVQLCLKSAVVEGCQNGNWLKGNWLNQIVLALSLLIPAFAHLMFYGDYSIEQLSVGMLLVLMVTGLAAKSQLPKMLKVSGKSKRIKPTQALGILRQHLAHTDTMWYVLLLLTMNFASGVLESYALPKIQAQFGGDGIVYALLAVGALYFVGSFVSLYVCKIRALRSPITMYLLMMVFFIGLQLTASLHWFLMLCALFFLLHPHIYVISDGQIQRSAPSESIGTHFSVIRVASFVSLSLGNLFMYAVLTLFPASISECGSACFH